jgi:acetate---CoA ligase (ADP-forming)
MTYGYAASAQRIPVYDRLAREHDKMVCIAWQAEWLEGPGVKEAEESENVAVFRSMSSVFAALAAWSWRAEKRAARHETVPSTLEQTRRMARALLDEAGGRVLTEREAKSVLALYGVPVVGEQLASDPEDAVNAAAALGYPVVLKVESPDLPHKTEAGVIRLDLRNADDVRAAYDAVMANAAAVSPPPRINGVLVQPMVPQGVEMVVGARVDPLFGPLVVVGLGGILVELLKDTALAPAPVTHRDALGLLGQLKGERLLRGFRGTDPVDLDRLAEVICRVSRFAADHRDAIAELDLNPLICAGDRITAVDALIAPAKR